jgi:hypothetical protein
MKTLLRMQQRNLAKLKQQKKEEEEKARQALIMEDGMEAELDENGNKVIYYLMM